MHIGKLICGVAFALYVSVASAQTPPPSAYSAPAAETASLSATSGPVGHLGTDELTYRLGPGDKIHVTTFGELELTGDFNVGANGVVSLPLVGDLPAGNLSVADFRDSIVKALKNGYILDPKVSVEVLTYRPFFVLGEVTHPGEFPYTSGLTVINAVATASGFTYRANTKRVLIRHQNEDKEHDYPMSSTTMIQPGDTITVKERFF